jgi:hypothetical protein
MARYYSDRYKQTASIITGIVLVVIILAIASLVAYFSN